MAPKLAWGTADVGFQAANIWPCHVDERKGWRAEETTSNFFMRPVCMGLFEISVGEYSDFAGNSRG